MTQGAFFADVFARIRGKLGIVDHQTGLAMPCEVRCPGLTREELGDETFELMASAETILVPRALSRRSLHPRPGKRTRQAS